MSSFLLGVISMVAIAPVVLFNIPSAALPIESFSPGTEDINQHLDPNSETKAVNASSRSAATQLSRKPMPSYPSHIKTISLATPEKLSPARPPSPRLTGHSTPIH